jgi:hypothetical protein
MARRGIVFLPELEQINWARRVTYIVYDSDSRTNPQVCSAINDLSKELMERGAFVHVVSLPDLGLEGKTGLDDYLLTATAEQYQELLDEAEPLTLSEPLWKLNDQVIFVRNPGLVIDKTTGQKIAPGAFRDYTHGTASYAERILKPDGSVRLKKTSASKVWLTWPLRSEAAGLTYAPGQPKLIQQPGGNGVIYNTWPGFSVQPKRGSVKPFTKLVDHLFRGATQEEKRWFVRWCAYPLQYPGTKLFTCVVLFGVKHGTGKSFLGYTLGRIYGQNFTEINRSHLHSAFNEWAEGRQLVMGDDVTGSDRRSDADLLKKLITQKELRVNQKFVASYVVPDRVNYFFTSNQPDAFFLEDTDRRFFVHEVTVDPLDEEFYASYDLWLSSDGPSAIYDYLLRLELGDFNPSAPALRTRAKDRMTSDVKSDLGTWVEKLKMDPDGTLVVGGRPLTGDLFTNRQLLAVYDPAGTSKVTANGLGRELRRAGFSPVAGGKPVRSRRGVERYYAIRNLEGWSKATSSRVAKYLNSHA